MKNDSQYPGRILAIDYGSKRVGLAISDPMQIVSQGIGIVDKSSALIEKILAIIGREQVAAILVGMPFSENGTKGPKAIEVDEFIQRLSRQVTIPLETWDESLTSVEARRVHLMAGMKKKKRREKGRVDVMAARLLLQDYLDNRSPLRVSSE